MDEKQIIEEIKKNVVEEATTNMSGRREIVIRTGKALEPKEPLGVGITGYHRYPAAVAPEKILYHRTKAMPRLGQP